ncbi:MAG: hypothetical protein U0V87_04015 [Acidobacteriota bacterium]
MNRSYRVVALLAALPTAILSAESAGPLEVERALVRGDLAGLDTPEANLYADLLRHRAGATPTDPVAIALQLARSETAAWRASGLQALAELKATPVGLDPAAALLLRPLLVAATGQCEGFEVLRDASSANTIEESLVLARAETKCGAYRSALLRTAGVIGDRTPDDPAVPLEALLVYGQIQARLGDDDNAALWCGAAAQRAAGLPSIQHPAALCAAAADARRGILPEARDRYITACEATANEPWLPPASRLAAALSGAWSVLNSDLAARGARAVALLQTAQSLPSGADDRRLITPLLGLAALAQGRNAEAERIVKTRPTDADAATSLLRGMVEAHWTENAGTASVAQQQFESVAKQALAVQQYELALAAATQASRIAQRMAVNERAHAILLDTLSEIPRSRLDRSTSVLVDPAVVRRAWQSLARVELGSSKSVNESVAAGLLEHIEWLRLRLAGESITRQRSASVETTRRFLASDDSALLVYMIGETQTYIWRVESTGLVLRILAPGDELFRIAGPLARGEDGDRPDPRAVALHGGLPHDLRVGETLLVLPDGFLYGIPWGALPPPPDDQQAQRFADAYDAVVAPSMRAICAPMGLLARDPDAPLGFLGLVVEGDGALPDPGNSALRRFDRYERVRVTGASLGGPTIVDDDAAVLHVSLPLIAATLDNDPLFGVTAARPGSALLPLTLGQTYRKRIPDLITIASATGPVAAPASRVRAAALAVERGSRSAIVSLHGHTGSDSAEIWGRLYADLARGRLNTKAVARLARREEESRAIGAHGLVVVGRGSSRVVEPEQPGWPFWLLIGLAGGIVAVAIWRLRRRTADPFTVEPPDET